MIPLAEIAGDLPLSLLYLSDNQFVVKCCLSDLCFKAGV